jgi:membrane protein DedA with SNARE-associated domain
MDFHALGDFVNDSANWVLGLGAGWIYLLVLVASFVENIFPPFPGDTVTVVGAALATTNDLSFALVFLSAYLGGITSTMLIYRFGFTHGHDYFMKRDYRYFPKKKIVELESWLNRSGWLLIAGSRFIVGFRTVVALSAGIARWPFWKMTFFSSLSFWVFNALLMTATYFLVDNLQLLVRYIKVYQEVFLIVVGLGVIYAIWRYIRARKTASTKDE